MRLSLVALLLAVVVAIDGLALRLSAHQRADLAVRANRVLDVRTGRYDGPVVLLVSGTRIARVIPANRFTASDAARVIDLGDLTVVPGLIDAHVHLGIGGPVRANAL